MTFQMVTEWVVEQWAHAVPMSEGEVVVAEVFVTAAAAASVVAEAEVLTAAAAVVEAAAAAMVTA